jgi:hypothetical protein
MERKFLIITLLFVLLSSIGCTNISKDATSKNLTSKFSNAKTQEQVKAKKEKTSTSKNELLKELENITGKDFEEDKKKYANKLTEVKQRFQGANKDELLREIAGLELELEEYENMRTIDSRSEIEELLNDRY